MENDSLVQALAEALRPIVVEAMQEALMEPDQDTVIEQELIPEIIDDIKQFGGMGKYPAWYDAKANGIRGGFNFRKP
jgi:glutathione synthase/RimK-type ligase-like ATP-grasp enzyme